MAFQYRFVHIAGIRQPHDDIPLHFFGKHLEGLGHVNLIGNPIRIVAVGDTQ